VFLTDLGGIDGQQNADGSMQDGSRGSFGRCSPDDPTSPRPPHLENDPGERFDPAESYALRMFVTGPLSEEAQRCLESTHAVSCPVTHGIEPLPETDAVFGFGDYVETRTPYVLDVFDWRYRALYVAGDGVDYLVDRAVFAAPDADQLVVRLPASDGRRIVEVVETGSGAPEQDRCFEKAGGSYMEGNDPANYAHCLTELGLRIDGVRWQPPEDTEYRGALVPPGEEHVITVEVVQGEPRFVRYALIIWEERP
jgi:hypothetical protein